MVGSKDEQQSTADQIVHGAGSVDTDSHVDRADKAAPLPEGEKGGAIEGFSVSAQGSAGLKQGESTGQGSGGEGPKPDPLAK